MRSRLAKRKNRGSSPPERIKGRQTLELVTEHVFAIQPSVLALSTQGAYGWQGDSLEFTLPLNTSRMVAARRSKLTLSKQGNTS